MRKAFVGFVLAVLFFAAFIYFDGGKLLVELGKIMEVFGKKLMEVTDFIKKAKP